MEEEDQQQQELNQEFSNQGIENNNQQSNSSIPEEQEEYEQPEECDEELEEYEKANQEKQYFINEIKHNNQKKTHVKFISKPVNQPCSNQTHQQGHKINIKENVVQMDTLEVKLKKLLEQAEIYATFLINRHKNKKNKESIQKKRRGNWEEEEEEEKDLIEKEEQALEDSKRQPTYLNSQPRLLKGGNLKDYQMVGLNWMISLMETGLNGILADQMGLGKTIQTIALIAFMKEVKKIKGPYLIIAPKSTLGNWDLEFKRWMPCCNVVKLIATKEERVEILEKYISSRKFDVCLTSYEGAKICQSHLKKIAWIYLIIDEAHKIKNEESQLSNVVRLFKTNYKILLTGTPLQNNLHELWSLLNFLLPDLFSSSDVFDDWFSANQTKQDNGEMNKEQIEEKNLDMINQLHKILKPFMLRRTKDEVEKTLPPKKEVHLYIGLTDLQVDIYKKLLKKQNLSGDSNDDKKFYLNVLMQLRKVCNHPYLFEGIEQDGLPTLGEHIVTASGKILVLDKLLKKLELDKHQVLIFSQMTMMLDILEDYCNLRGYRYCRIDGNTEMNDRDNQIAEFTRPGSDQFIFLLSTRAGGLGINLWTADTVVLYDSDWNPQMDLQAMDRAHRIGQKNKVLVYRLICENTIEEKIIERQTIKLRWDSLVIQQGKLGLKNKVFSKEELKDMVCFGASKIFKAEGCTYKDDDIDFILQRGDEKTKELNEEINAKFQNKDVLNLGMSSINIYDFLGASKNKNQEDLQAMDDIMLRELYAQGRPQRRSQLIQPNYNIDAQLSSMFSVNQRSQPIQVRKCLLPEHHLYINRERLQQLIQKELDYKAYNKDSLLSSSNNKKQEENAEQDQLASGQANPNGTLDQEGGQNAQQQQQQQQQSTVPTNLYGLTPEEKEEKDKLNATGFPNWLKQEYLCFLQGLERYGRNNYAAIAAHIKTKTEEEVSEYSKAFWERINDLQEKEKIVKRVELGEATINQRGQYDSLLKEKCKQYKNPKEEMQFEYDQAYNKSKSRFYTLENDKFLIYSSYENGFGAWDKIRKIMKQERIFTFDHFFKSRSDSELNKRTLSLIKVLEKEKQENKWKNENSKSVTKISSVMSDDDNGKSSNNNNNINNNPISINISNLDQHIINSRITNNNNNNPNFLSILDSSSMDEKLDINDNKSNNNSDQLDEIKKKKARKEQQKEFEKQKLLIQSSNCIIIQDDEKLDNKSFDPLNLVNNVAGGNPFQNMLNTMAAGFNPIGIPQSQFMQQFMQQQNNANKSNNIIIETKDPQLQGQNLKSQSSQKKHKIDNQAKQFDNNHETGHHHHHRHHHNNKKPESNSNTNGNQIITNPNEHSEKKGPEKFKQQQIQQFFSFSNNKKNSQSALQYKMNPHFNMDQLNQSFIIQQPSTVNSKAEKVNCEEIRKIELDGKKATIIDLEETKETNDQTNQPTHTNNGNGNVDNDKENNAKTNNNNNSIQIENNQQNQNLPQQ